MQPDKKIISRLAPTPSGYLHKGNIFNFLHTWERVKKSGGKLLLRIDDLDATRCSREYIDDIFNTLAKLGIQPDGGPKDTDDFLKHHSQGLKKELYWQHAKKLLEGGQAYACQCSRSQIAKKSNHGIYPETCRDLNLRHTPGRTTIRFRRDQHKNRDDLGDFVIWRREDLPAYHLVSVIEDVQNGVNLIVRGEDLLPSTWAQQDLARALGFEEFEKIHFVHHPLITGEDGKKLSKTRKPLCFFFPKNEERTS